jgi:hypothetical protein
MSCIEKIGLIELELNTGLLKKETSKLWLKSINSSRIYIVKIEFWRFPTSNRLVESVNVDLDEW